MAKQTNLGVRGRGEQVKVVLIKIMVDRIMEGRISVELAILTK